jgi:DNA-binding transcriptional LysR family regulator
VTHKFEDAFTVIVPTPGIAGSTPNKEPTLEKRDEWMSKEHWLLISENSQTGQQLRSWLTKQKLRLEPAMQLDNFDLIINLVALGMGASLVPIRALALYHQKRGLQRVTLQERFVRELVVVVRKNRKVPPHLQEFVESILF